MIDPRTSVELWLVDLDACAPALDLIERDVPRLADDDRARAEAIGDARECHRRLAAYTALRMLLERVAGTKARRQPFVRAAGAKPRLGDGSAEFNLSHTEGHALIGVSRALPLGVDLERARPAKMSARRRGEIIAAGAGLGDKPLPDLGHERTFIQAWARLEAFAKAGGDGLAQTLANLGLRGGGQGRSQVPLAQVEAAARRLVAATGLAVRDVPLPPGWHGAVAMPRGARCAHPRKFPARRVEIDPLLADSA
jgi:4'-phosphopantetheinyl transferase